MLTQEKLWSILEYFPVTGNWRWKVKGRGKKEEVGWIDSQGYHCVGIDGKSYLLHRLVFLYVMGTIPDQVDHIDHNCSNNQWINLRSANYNINSKNRTIRKDNTSGVTGVYWSTEKSKWQVKISFDGRNRHMGYFLTKEEAIIHRKQLEEIYGYHANHGK